MLYVPEGIQYIDRFEAQTEIKRNYDSINKIKDTNEMENVIETRYGANMNDLTKFDTIVVTDKKVASECENETQSGTIVVTQENI